MQKKAILIAGPTASGKSTLALKLASALNGVIINADALQVYSNWRILTARPSVEDQLLAQHFLYGHIQKTAGYSVGIWLREVSQLIENENIIPIIVGGTGLYLSALTNGLSEIPPVPDSIRQMGNEIRITQGGPAFLQHLEQQDPETLRRLDKSNPARLQRAWEVLEATGKGLAYWHARPAPPILPLESTMPITLNWHPDELKARIDTRFDAMMASGAITECETALREGFDPDLPSGRAIGAREIISALEGKISMQEAVAKAKILTRQFAKRQRSWFRSKMKDWHEIKLPDNESINELVHSAKLQFR